MSKHLVPSPLDSRSIAQQLVRWLLALGILATLLTSIVQAYREYLVGVEQIHTQFQTIQNTHGPSLASSLWHFSEKQIEIELKGLLNTSNIEFAQLKSENGNAWAVGSESSTGGITKSFPLIFLHGEKGIKVGTLHVYAGMDQLYARIKSNFLNNLLYAGIWTFFLAGSLFLVVRQLVTRHLNALSQYTASLHLGKQTPPLVLDRPVPRGVGDEFDLVVGAINAMQNKLTESISELKDNELRYRGLFDNSDVSIWEEDFTFISKSLEDLRRAGVTDLRHYLRENERLALELVDQVKVTRVNEATLNLFGAKNNEEMVINISKTFGPDAIDVFIEELCAIWDSEGSFRAETHFRTLDGREFPAIISFQIPKGTDEFRSVPISIVDISEQVKVRAEIVRRRAEFEAIINSISDAIVFVDPQRKIVAINPSFTNTFGYRLEDLTGQTSQIIYADPDNFLKQGMQRFTPEASPEQPFFENDYRRKDGSTFPGETLGAKVVSDDGEMLGFIGVIRDITARKQAETEIHKLNAELEQRVLDRTADLQMANQELEAFTYSVSHDLRAPLRHLTGFSKLLQENDQAGLDDAARRYLSIISEAAVRMGQLIDDLLDFSRVGRAELCKKPVNLDALVKEVVRALLPDTQERRILFQIDPLPCVSADANLLRAVLTNLFSNAIKFTRPRDEAKIQMGCNEDEHEHIFFIRDNGVGFEMKYVENLFGVFQRLHTTEQFEGTGIGLANVRRSILRHGGRTWAESVISEGATFYFSLPKATAHKNLETKNPERKTI